MHKDVSLWQVLILLLLFLLLFPKVLSVSTLPADLLVDHGDRLVEIPGIVRKIYATTEMGTFLAYALEPDCIPVSYTHLGFPRKPRISSPESTAESWIRWLRVWAGRITQFTWIAGASSMSW